MWEKVFIFLCLVVFVIAILIVQWQEKRAREKAEKATREATEMQQLAAASAAAASEAVAGGSVFNPFASPDEAEADFNPFGAEPDAAPETTPFNPFADAIRAAPVHDIPRTATPPAVAPAGPPAVPAVLPAAPAPVVRAVPAPAPAPPAHPTMPTMPALRHVDPEPSLSASALAGKFGGQREFTLGPSLQFQFQAVAPQAAGVTFEPAVARHGRDAAAAANPFAANPAGRTASASAGTRKPVPRGPAAKRAPPTRSGCLDKVLSGKGRCDAVSLLMRRVCVLKTSLAHSRLAKVERRYYELVASGQLHYYKKEGGKNLGSVFLKGCSVRLDPEDPTALLLQSGVCWRARLTAQRTSFTFSRPHRWKRCSIG